jgi:NAD+ kinase
MKTIGVIYKKEDKLIAGTAEQVIKELKSQGYKIDLKKAQFVITLGGDGTILRAARLVASAGTPILGVHMGGLGFHSEIELSGLPQALEQIKKKKFTLDERTMIEARTGGKKLTALNDIVISKSGIARVIRLNIVEIAEYVSDGLIFSSASGSTAYNLSAGGPILTPHSKSVVITAICPHTINSRPLVVEKPVTVVLNRGQEVILTADGQEMVPLREGQTIIVRASPLKTRFIRLGEYDFFGRVKKVFGLAARN